MNPANLSLSRYAKGVVAVTFGLIFLGGMVTTLGAGMSVPDWPTTFGYNMFTFPISRWKGLVFWEHSHRYVASILGILTTILAVWVWLAERRPWVRRLGVFAFGLVVLQGIMGGLRVTKISIALAIVHGCVAQLFFCLTVLLALVLSPRWERPALACVEPRRIRSLKRWGWALTIVAFVQLVLGAIMRHLQAGLAIPTFPLTPDGRLMPSNHSMEVDIHFSHRFWAVIVTAVALVLVVKILRWARSEREFLAPAIGIMVLLAGQIALGASIIWFARASIPTTLHVSNGAAILALAFTLAVRATHRAKAAGLPAPLPAQPGPALS